MSPQAWRILSIFLGRVVDRGENWFDREFWGYIPSWELGEMLGEDGATIQSTTVHHNPGNEYEIALRELIDLGLVREMLNLGERFELVVKESKQEQSEPAKEPTIAEYWSQPLSVQGAIKGRSNTNEKKQAIIERLSIVWCQMPDLRLGQLLLNVFRDTPWYYLEDEPLIEQLEKFYKKP